MQPNTSFKRISRKDLPADFKPIWDRTQELHGDTTFIEVMANAPEATRWYFEEFYNRLYASGRLDKRIVELVRLRLANIHGCAFCNRADRIAALSSGMSEAEVDAIANYESGPFDDRQKAALALSDEIALTNPTGHISKALHARLHAHFSEGEIIELGLVASILAGMAKFIFAYDLVEKEDTCPFIPAAAQ